MAIAVLTTLGALAHQVVVRVVFRLQLHRAVLTQAFGARDMAEICGDGAG